MTSDPGRTRWRDWLRAGHLHWYCVVSIVVGEFWLSKDLMAEVTQRLVEPAIGEKRFTKNSCNRHKLLLVLETIKDVTLEIKMDRQSWQ